MPLSRLIYISENLLDRRQGSVLSQLSGILSASNRNNRAAGITGALLFDDFWFLQALEGEKREVLRTYKRIERDGRHGDVALVELVDVPDRLFGNWWMGLAMRESDTDPLFAPYVSGGRLAAEDLSGAQILTLMSNVAARGLRREVKAAA